MLDGEVDEVRRGCGCSCGGFDDIVIEKAPANDESEAGQGASFDHHLVPPVLGSALYAIGETLFDTKVVNTCT